MDAEFKHFYLFSQEHFIVNQKGHFLVIVSQALFIQYFLTISPFFKKLDIVYFLIMTLKVAYWGFQSFFSFLGPNSLLRLCVSDRPKSIGRQCSRSPCVIIAFLYLVFLTLLFFIFLIKNFQVV